MGTKEVIPRSKPIPKPKKLTKWEKFALEKGINKRKRDSKVYDEITDSYVPTYGPKSIKKVQDKANWLIEENNDKENIVKKYGVKAKRIESNILKRKNKTDPFTEKSLNKSLKNQKEKLKVEKNKPTKKKDNEIKDLVQGDLNENNKIGKNKLKHSIKIAKDSTSSKGKFDKKSHADEKNNKRKRRDAILNDFDEE